MCLVMPIRRGDATLLVDDIVGVPPFARLISDSTPLTYSCEVGAHQYQTREE